MPWVRVSDDFYDHRKFADVTAFGIGAWILGLAYCNRNLTDGVLPSRTAERLVEPGDLAIVKGMGGRDAEGSDAISELLDAGLWHEDEHDCPDCINPGPGRYVVHGYADYQWTADKIKQEHEQKSEAGRKGAASRWAKTAPMASAMADAIAPAMAEQWQNDAPNPNPNPEEQKRTTSSSSVANATKTKRATRIPDDFPAEHDTERLWSWALENCPGVPIKIETDQWLDYHRAKGDTAKDWTASWRTWMRNAQKYSERNGGRTPGQLSIAPANRSEQRTLQNVALIEHFRQQEQGA